MSHLRILGFLCFKNENDANRKKLQDKSEVMILVGYHAIRAYRLFNPAKQKIEVSRDVMVSEVESWDSKNQMSNPNSIILVQNEKDTTSNVAQNQKSQRDREFPAKYTNFEMLHEIEVTPEGDLVHFALLADAEPIDHEEAMKEYVWKKAIMEELKAIERNHTQELVELPLNKKSIDVKWVFKLKLNPNGSIARHKARLVSQRIQEKAWCRLYKSFCTSGQA